MIIDFLKMFQDSSMGKEQSLQQMVLRQVDIHMEKNEVRPLPHTISKIYQRPKCELKP